MRKKTASQKLREGEKDKRKTSGIDLTFDGTLRRPIGLNSCEKNLWKKVVPSLVKNGLATAIDQPALRSLCEWYSLYKDSHNALKKQEVGSIEYGRVLISITKSFDNFRRMAREYGLTANSRTGIEMSPPTNSETDKFFT